MRPCRWASGKGAWLPAPVAARGSNGLYVALRPCPGGTGQWAAFVAGGSVATILGTFTDFALFGRTFVIGGLVPIVAVHDSLIANSGGGRILANGLGGVFVLIGLGTLWLRFGERWRADKRLRSRVETRGTIVAVEPTHTMVNSCPRARLQIRVEPHDLPAYVSSKTITVSMAEMPRIAQNVAVWYDPHDPKQVALGLATTLQMQQAIDAGTLPKVTGGTFACSPDNRHPRQHPTRLRRSRGSSG